MKKILLACSCMESIELVEASLQAFLLDVEVLKTTSGVECLSIANKEKPNMILLQADMKCHTGQYVAQYLKSDPLTTEILILLFTNAHTEKQAVLSLENWGTELMLNKLNIIELSEKIQSVLSLKKPEIAEHITNGYQFYNNIPNGIAIVAIENFIFMNNYLKELLQIDVDLEQVKIEDIILDWKVISQKLYVQLPNTPINFESSLRVSKNQFLDCQLAINLIEGHKYLISITGIARVKKQSRLKEIILSLYELSNSFNEMEEFSQQVWELIKSTTQANGIYLGLYSPMENILQLVFQDHCFLPTRIAATRLPHNLVIQSRTPICLNSEQISLMQQKLPYELCAKTCYWYGVPLLNNNRLQGVVSFIKDEALGVFDEEEKADLMLISNTIASIFETRIIREDLNMALNKALQSEKLKDNFLCNISHEIRTPLNAIIGFSSMLYDEVSVEDKKEYLDMIMDGGQNLMKIIDDIVDIAKIQSGEIKIHNLETDIFELMNNLKIKFKNHPELQINPLKIELELPDKLNQLLIKTDPFRLNQIIDNLILNAIKFTNTGTIKFGLHFINNEALRFFVSDTGIGIPEDKLQSIFDRFTQIETGHAREYGGNGLGLSITKNLVTLLNGTISVESKLGEGSVFSFTLPIEKQKFVDKKSIKTIYNWQGKNILMVDDVVANLEYLNLLLKKTGANIFWANNGLKALEVLASNPEIDLILMDLQMPKMDGYQATRLIKSKNPNIKIIAQTAFTENSNREKAYESGCDDYLEKPIKPDVLLTSICKLL